MFVRIYIGISVICMGIVIFVIIIEYSILFKENFIFENIYAVMDDIINIKIIDIEIVIILFLR